MDFKDTSEEKHVKIVSASYLYQFKKKSVSIMFEEDILFATRLYVE